MMFQRPGFPPPPAGCFTSARDDDGKIHLCANVGPHSLHRCTCGMSWHVATPGDIAECRTGPAVATLMRAWGADVAREVAHKVLPDPVDDYGSRARLGVQVGAQFAVEEILRTLDVAAVDLAPLYAHILRGE